MSIFNEAGEQITNAFNSTNLKFATRGARAESGEIKERVRDRMAKLTEENKQASFYETLVAIHDQIEANHDAIYARPDNGSSASRAVADCEELLSQQQTLELEFNIVYAALTSDPSVLNQAKDQAVEITKEKTDNIVAKANEIADATKHKTKLAKEKVTEWKDELVSKIEDAKDKAKEKTKEFGDKVDEKAHDAGDEAKKLGDKAEDKAKELGDKASDKAEEVRDSVKRPKPRP